MERSHSWEAKISQASQEISRILRMPQFHDSIHNSMPLVLIQIQINPLHTLP